MSDSYQELDLDNLGGKPRAADSDIEIVDEAVAPEPSVAPQRTAVQSETDDDDDDGDEGAAPAEKRRLTRSQRLKAQRDTYARQLTEVQSKLADAEAKASKYERDATDGASIGLDLYIQNIDSSMQALRRDFDAAFDNGDREKIFEVQQRIATLAADKAQAEREKRSIPTRPAQSKSGSEPPQQTQQTPRSQPKATANPAAMEWFGRNDTWFNKDAVATAAARVIDQQMVQEGFEPSDPDYFDELDRRLKKEMPNKFGGDAPAQSRPRASSPTIQNRGTVPTANGKVRVTITQSDRDMANHLGISIESYAREKARREKAQETTNQYTEIT